MCCAVSDTVTGFRKLKNCPQALIVKNYGVSRLLFVKVPTNLFHEAKILVIRRVTEAEAKLLIEN